MNINELKCAAHKQIRVLNWEKWFYAISNSLNK